MSQESEIQSSQVESSELDSKNSQDGHENDINEGEIQKPGKNKRLMIQKIVLENFKSYYGKKEIGPLHKCFSAVVGPNGSGKSNLIESLLFVFGKRAKRMRLNKLSELIHSSAQHKDSVKFAMVEVFFQDIYDDEKEEDSFEIVPRTQFSVARKVDRQSKSTYLINGQDSSFKEVCELLSNKGIDLEHNRFLILQGEVEQISLMKPMSTKENEVGLLEYLEDIIGSNQYIEQIDEIEEGISVKNDERIMKLNKVKAAFAELQGMEDEKNLAVNYLKMERDYMLLSNMQYFIELGDSVKIFNVNIEKATALKNSLKEKINEMQEKFKENQEVIIQLQTLNVKRDEATNNVEKLNNDFKQLEKDDVIIQQQIKNEKSLTENLKKLVTKLQNSKENMIGECNQIEKEMPNLEKQFKENSEKKLKKDKDFEKLDLEVRTKTEALRKKKEEITNEMNPLTSKAQMLHTKIESDLQEVQIVDEKVGKIEQEISICTLQVNSNQEVQQQAQQDYDSHKETLDKIKKEAENIKTSFESVQKQVAESQGELRQLRDRKNQMVSSQQEKKDQGKVLKALLQAQEQGVLTGVHGRLGDLGSIDLKYDIAISTACASSLDNIVTDTIKDAENCIKFLKQNNIGRGNFMGLDKMVKHTQQRQKQFVAPPDSLRLFDLIKVKDDKFQDAFYFAVKDTLVAENINIGSKVAFDNGRSHKVVTLEGQIIEQSGLMSGGGRPKQGLMSNKIVEEFSQDQIKKVQDQVSQVENKLNKLQTEFQKHEQMQAQTQMRYNEQSAQSQKFKSTVENITEHSNRAQQKLQELNGRLEKGKKDAEQVNQIKIQIGQDQDELKQIIPEIQALEKKLVELENQINEVGGIAYKNQKAEIDALAQKISEIDKIITKNKATLDNGEAKLKQFDEDIQTKQEEIKKNGELLEELKQKQLKFEADAEKLMEEIDQYKQLKAEFDEQLEKTKAEFNAIKRQIQSQQDEQEVIKGQLDEAGQQKIQLKQKCDELKTVIKKNREDFKRQARDYEGIISDPEPEQEPSFIDSEDDQIQEQDQESQQIQEQKEAKDEESSQVEQQQNPRQQSRSAHIQEQGYLFFLKQQDIMKSFKDEEIQLLIRDKKKIIDQAKSIKGQLQDSQPNIRVIQEYKLKMQDKIQKEKNLNDCESYIIKSKKDLQIYKKKRHDEFMVGLNFISKEVKAMYQLITNGGDAELEIKDSLDPFAEGVLYQVRPNKKTWKHMSKLSGGEKTLSSLSLIFALHMYKPSPLYCMDEIDAALDYKNVAIVGKYIREKAKNCQFIIISLRNNMFDLAQKMVGIYKTYDITKTLTINPQKMLLEVQKKKEQVEQKSIDNQRIQNNQNQSAQVMDNERIQNNDNNQSALKIDNESERIALDIEMNENCIN